MPANWRLGGEEITDTTFKCAFLHFQWAVAAYPLCVWCLGLVKKTFQCRKIDQGTFSKSALPPEPFNLLVHFLCTVTLLNVICSFPIVKPFCLRSFPLRISSLLSCPFFLCEPSPPPPPPLAGSFGLTPFVSVIRQIRGLRFGGVLVPILLGQHLRSQWERSLIAQY